MSSIGPWQAELINNLVVITAEVKYILQSIELIIISTVDFSWGFSPHDFGYTFRNVIIHAQSPEISLC